MSENEQHPPGIWRPLTVRGVPLHLVLPTAIAIVGFGLLAGGGLAAVLGAWVLTIGFSLAVGAFVADQRALAVPALVWTAWVIVGAIAGAQSGLPRTPIALAIVLAAAGAACVWLGQRAVQPALEGERHAARHRQLETDLDALLEPFHRADSSPSLDPSAEVDEALAELLDAPIDESDPVTEPETVAAQPQVETEADDDPAGHVIEFEALSEDDLDADDAPLPAATEAARRGDRPS